MSDVVVLTGATGFLGMEVLARLLEHTDSEVIALVRARDREAAAERLGSVFARLYDVTPAGVERVTAIPGDVSVDGLGLSSRDRCELLARATSIVHCAASIAFDLPADEAHNVNAGGASRMLSLASELAEAGRLRRMVHVSTAYVCGRHAGVFGEEDLDVGQTFRNTYEQSKAHAESVLASGGHGLPLVIARPSIVVGDSRSGWTPSFNVIYWPLRAFSRGLLGEVPADPAGVLDVIPVDYAAEGILALHDAGEIAGTVHLVAGRHAVSNREMMALACAHYDRADAGFGTEGSLPNVQEAALYLPYFDVRARFDDRRARAALELSGIVCPPLQSYFSTLLDYAERARWGKLALTRESAHLRAGATI